VPSAVVTPSAPFDRLINSWHAVTYVLNSLNRGMGLGDAYPFVLAPAAIEKLRFVHDVLKRAPDFRLPAPDAGSEDPAYVA